MLIREKRSGQQPRVSVSWNDFNFHLYEKFCPGSQGWIFHMVFFWVSQFDFSYSSTIITLNSAFILGLSASKCNPVKAICDFFAEIQSITKVLYLKHVFFPLPMIHETTTSKPILFSLQHAPFLFLWTTILN